MKEEIYKKLTRNLNTLICLELNKRERGEIKVRSEDA